MSTLFEAMLNLSRRVRSVRYGTATGGTTTTLIDTVLRHESDDAFNGQTVLVFSGDNINTTRQITDFVNSTNTLTVGTAWSNAIASGVRYGIANANREALVQAINAGLEEIGEITQVDDSNLTVVNDQTEYTLPSGVSNVVRVEIASTDSGDYDYHRLYDWLEVDGELYFDNEIGFTSGRKIRVYYKGKHDAVSSDTDTISESIPVQLLGSTSAYWFMMAEYADKGNVNDKDTVMLQKAEQNMLIAKQNYKVNRMHRDPKLGS